MPTIYVVPAEGLQVRDPKTADHLPTKGREVQDNSYWRRRIKDEDVTLGNSTAEAKSTSTKTKPKAMEE